MSSSKVMIIGAGRVGVAAAKFALHAEFEKVILVDSRFEALTNLNLKRSQHSEVVTITAKTEEELETVISQQLPNVIVCSTPFSVNITVAKLAAKYACSYIDFTEDVSVTEAIAALPTGDCTFVPQTGLAPGLVSYLGLDLFKQLGEPKELALRVGALPLAAFGPGHYCITWSPEGLVNEYLNPVNAKIAGHCVQLDPLQHLESVLINGHIYEAFTTSGGIGLLDAYEGIPSVSYKTLRHPGHLDVVKQLLAAGGDEPFASRVDRFKREFNTTRDDRVVLLARAVDQDNRAACAALEFYPNTGLDMTALELTTAGTGMAVVELLLLDVLPKGVLTARDIPLNELKNTNSYRLMMRSATE